MDLQKERDLYLAELLEREVITQDEFRDLVFKPEINAFDSNYLSSRFIDKINFGWSAWQAKAQAIPDGFVLVPRKSIEHWYLDEGEYLWMDEPDNWLCDMDVGDVQEVEHKEYIVTESNTLYATKVWDDENQDVSSWEFFNSKDDAEKAAEYCKAMIEARDKNNE